MPFHLHLFKKHQSPGVSSILNPVGNFPRQHKFDRELQKGTEGVVEQWTHNFSGTVLAVKVIKHSDQLPGEVVLLRDLPPHNSIIRFLGYFDMQPSPEKSSILLEYCPEGDLWDIRQRAKDLNNGVFSEASMWSMYNQLAAALAFLHEGIDSQNPLGRDNWKPVIHRDIKMENVLVKNLGSKDDWSGIELKLCDFGMAGYYDPANPNPLRLIGTTSSWPPEVTWETRRMSPASDVWGIGAIIHDLAHNFGPTVSIAVTQKQWFSRNIEAPYPENWPEEFKLNYWRAKTPRRVVPINLDPDVPLSAEPEAILGGPDEYVDMKRKDRPSPEYSNALNECMMVALKMDPRDRVEAGDLLSRIEEAHAEFLFQQLSTEHKRETMQDIHEDYKEEEDY